MLTRSEATTYLRDGSLPENFAGRVENIVEFEHCTNCDGRLCMGCVLRVYEHECRPDCPFCCACPKCDAVELRHCPPKSEGGARQVKCAACGWQGYIELLLPGIERQSQGADQFQE